MVHVLNFQFTWKGTGSQLELAWFLGSGAGDTLEYFCIIKEKPS